MPRWIKNHKKLVCNQSKVGKEITSLKNLSKTGRNQIYINWRKDYPAEQLRKLPQCMTHFIRINLDFRWQRWKRSLVQFEITRHEHCVKLERDGPLYLPDSYSNERSERTEKHSYAKRYLWLRYLCRRVSSKHMLRFRLHRCSCNIETCSITWVDN